MTKFNISTLIFNQFGLIPAIAQQYDTGDVLMMAWMNAESITQTLKTKQVTYWSRSRLEFWVKGKTSGHTQALIDMRIDCDRDCMLVLGDQIGAAGHTNRKNCFYTSVLEEEVELFKPMK